MSRVLDLVLTLWILFVAVVYFGGFFWQAIGMSTAVFDKVYAGMLIASVAVLCWRWLTRKPGDLEA
jgi:hypothetical protein